MNHCLTDTDLYRYHAGELDATATERIRQHLAQCPRCAGRDAELTAQQEDLLEKARDLKIPIDTATAPLPPAGAPAEASWTAHAQTALFSAPQLAGYELLREIHQGGQGVIFQALQKSTKRKVAIKVMREGPLASTDDKIRFEREVEILGQLQHAHIVTIHDSGAAAGYFYYVMDYISGQPFGAYIMPENSAAQTDGPTGSPPRLKHTLSQTELLRLFVKICRAVQAAHLRGITHRDLKPGNLLIDDNGEPHVLDFGMAKVGLGGLTNGPTPHPMTITGQFIGSIPWASPEQAEGIPGKIDVRTDVYALGVMLYQILTDGNFPYEVIGNMRDVLGRILQVEPVPPHRFNPRIDGDLETITLKCLAKARDRRYANAGELADDLERYLAGQPIAARRDSFIYVLRMRGREFLRKQPVLSVLLGLLLSLPLAQLCGGFLLENTPLDRWFEKSLTTGVTPSWTPAPFQDVRVIAFSDETAARLRALADHEQLTGLTMENRVSLRRLHGRLMEKLALAPPAAVVWDIYVRNASEFDVDFLRGVRALRACRPPVEVVISTEDWARDERGLPPEDSAAILSEARFGSAIAWFDAQGPWRLELVAQCGPGDLRPSLALAGLQTFRYPGAEASLQLDAGAGRLDLRYYKPNPAIPQARPWLGPPETIELTSVEMSDDTERGDLRADTLVGNYQLNVPPDDVLQRATITYENALLANTAQLREWFASKLVLIGFTQKDVDIHGYPDGRHLHGCYGHAVGIDALLRKIVVRRPTVSETYPLTLLGALLGLAAGLSAADRPGRRCVLLLGLTLLAALVSILAYWVFSYLCNPLIPIIALVLTCEWTAFVRGSGQSRAA